MATVIKLKRSETALAIPSAGSLAAGELASTSNIGVASFTSDNFTVTSGDVAITTVDGGSF